MSEVEAAPAAPAAPKPYEDENRILKFLSKDGKEIELALGVAKMSEFIAGMLKVFEDAPDAASDAPIDLDISGEILEKIAAYLKWHHANPKALDLPDEDFDEEEEDNTGMDDGAFKYRRTDDIIEWDKQFIAVENPVLFEMLLAANYLNIRILLDLILKAIANQIKGKTTEEIRVHFGIKNDFTPEEEKQIALENSWIEEK